MAPEPCAAIVPQTAPAQPVPVTLHAMPVAGLELAAGVKVAEKFALVPALIEEGPLIENAKRLVTMMAAAALFDGSATLVAVSRIVGGDGRICGAVKRPLVLTVPQAAPEQPAPLAVQFTAVFGWPAEETVA